MSPGALRLGRTHHWFNAMLLPSLLKFLIHAFVLKSSRFFGVSMGSTNTASLASHPTSFYIQTHPTGHFFHDLIIAMFTSCQVKMEDYCFKARTQDRNAWTQSFLSSGAWVFAFFIYSNGGKGHSPHHTGYDNYRR